MLNGYRLRRKEKYCENKNCVTCVSKTIQQTYWEKFTGGKQLKRTSGIQFHVQLVAWPSLIEDRG